MPRGSFSICSLSINAIFMACSRRLKGIINRGHHKVARCENKGKNITKEREIVFILRPAWLLKTSRILFSISDCNRRLSVYLCSATFLPSCNPPTPFRTWPTGRVVQSVLSSGLQPPNMDTFHMPCDKRLSTVAPRLLGSSLSPLPSLL